MLNAAAAQVDVRVEAVDGCGLLPLSLVDRTFVSAHHFRRFLQKRLGEHLLEQPNADALDEVDLPRAAVPKAIRERWPEAEPRLLDASPEALRLLPIDHAVGRTGERGGGAAARVRLGAFLDDGLDRYREERNQPDANASSGLSPWLHYGHVSTHEILHALTEREGWSPARLGSRTDGARAGWWGLSPSAEAFLDELVTWRELGFAYCWFEPRHDRYDGDRRRPTMFGKPPAPGAPQGCARRSP